MSNRKGNLVVERFNAALDELIQEQVAQLTGLREEIADAVAQGDDATLFEAFPNHLAVYYTLGAYNTVRHLVAEHTIDFELMDPKIDAFRRWLAGLDPQQFATRSGVRVAILSAFEGIFHLEDEMVPSHE